MTQSKIDVLVNYLMQNIEQTKGIISDNAPLIIKQYLNYEMFTTSVLVSVLLITTLIGIYYIGSFTKRYNIKSTSTDLDDIGYAIAIAITSAITFISGAILVNYLFYLFKLIIAPDIAVLEYLKTLIH